MDFLRIRQKAKAAASKPAPERGGEPGERAAAAAPPSALEPEERLEDALRAELARPSDGLRSEDRGGGAVEGDPLDEFFWREDETFLGLPEVALGSMAGDLVEEPEERSEWLTFLLGGEEYAVAIEQVREILKPPIITEVPRAPAHVLGVIMVRGEVIAVFDPRRRLGLPPAPAGRQQRVMVCDAGDGARGLLVDAVSQVVRLPRAAIEARPTGIGGPAADFITAIGREGDKLFILLDLAAVLHDVTPNAPEAA